MYQDQYDSNMTNQNVVSFAKGDLNGDTIPDNVFLTGIVSPDSPFVQNITLVIQDGMTKMNVSVLLKENAGYNPTLFLGDFTGNGVDDILISIATGGSGGVYYYYIYSFTENVACLLFDSDDYNEQYKYDVVYKDNYKVEVISKINSNKYLLDIIYKDDDYLKEIYDKSGKLKKPISGWVDPISGLYPVDFDLDGVYELLAIQSISGKYHADSLGNVQNILKWKNPNFVLDNQKIAIWGFEV